MPYTKILKTIIPPLLPGQSYAGIQKVETNSKGEIEITVVVIDAALSSDDVSLPINNNFRIHLTRESEE